MSTSITSLILPWSGIHAVSKLVNPVNVTNQTFIMKHRPVAPGWRVSKPSVATCSCTRVGHIYATHMDLCCVLCQLMNSDALAYTCKSPLGRAVERFAVCVLCQASKSQQSKYHSHAKPVWSVIMYWLCHTWKAWGWDTLHTVWHHPAH